MKSIFQFRFLQLMVMALLVIPLTGFSPVNDVEPDSEVRWRKARKLSWDDFRGRADRGTRMDALTESGIAFSWTCGYRGFDFDAYAMFVPEKSWVRQRTPALLAHEQLHFDITELHARKIRKYFKEVANPCRLGQRAINAAAQRFIRESTEMQHQYDQESRHSENEPEQARWQEEVDSQLRRLGKYAE